MQLQHLKTPPAFVTLSLITVLMTDCSSEQKGMCMLEKCRRFLVSQKATPWVGLSFFLIHLVWKLAIYISKCGPLQSSDQQKCIPSAVTGNGWLLQCLSDTQFSTINAPQDTMIVFTCLTRTRTL
ncbi:hypothetical protein LU631_09865 [Erwinia tracheiphila]|uniref:hypothetical protein n=3 Tax=Erwinia tracheiphila TaxID=65700 RepID=UPI000ABA11B2|nr:hypothetical protein [Erwinia tracheiphila]UIA82258.1 hypothetical protein LU604_16930 [Erwinia tracheiphila]UIA89463.1 hypothetical protein LU631_09865 [Erwinia tracheiphila]UIA90855.1 hypothetical protein LU632_16520 [Erwinia tracheiphila]UIA97845.1 hypothetical protein LU633_08545 [Erwinia tracheiphila]